MIEDLKQLLSRNDLSEEVQLILKRIIAQNDYHSLKAIQEIANKLPDLILIFQKDSNGDIRLKFVNNAIISNTKGFYKDKLGLTHQEIYENEPTYFLLGIRRVLESGIPIQEKIFWKVSKISEKRWFDTDCVQINENTVLIKARDITEDINIQEELKVREQQYEEFYERIKAAEIALQQSEQEYKIIFDHSPISLWEEDYSEIKKNFEELKKEGITDIREYLNNHPQKLEKLIKLVQVVNVNETSVKLFKAESKEDFLIGLGSFFDQDSRSSFQEEMIALFNGATEFQIESPGRKLTGEHIDTLVKIFIPKGFEDSLSKVLISVIDITELKKVEERFKQLFEFSPVAMWEEDLSEFNNYFKNLRNQGIVDFQDYFNDNPEEVKNLLDLVKILDVNKACLDLYGTSDKQHLIDSIHKIFGKDSLHVFLDATLQLMGGVKIVEMENINYNIATGKRMYVNFRSTRISDKYGKETKGIVTIIDISERKQLEEIRVELEQRRENFIYMTSHELRTPLTVSKGYCTFLLSKLENIPPDILEKSLITIQSNLDRLERLIGGFNNLIQIQKGTLEIQKKEFTLIEEINDIFSLYKERLGNNFEISSHKHHELLTFLGDKDRIREVFENIIENAIKHTDKERTKIQASYEIHSGKIIIKVSDNGAGIESENLEKIFKQFVSIPTIYAVTGTGIGLYLAKWIIEAHGGSITAESPGVDKGSVFTVILPI